jgi:ABC-type antimicrobial peptide transport system permease subunit
MSAGSRNGVYRVFGVRPPWAGVRDFGAERGAFLTEDDIASSARVCVIGQTVARELFGNAEAIGGEVLVNQVPFQVKGVLVPKGASPAEGDRDARIVIPITTFYDRLYRRLHLDQIVVQAGDSSADTLASLEQQIRVVLREQHRIADAGTDDFVGAVLAMLIIGLVTQQGVRVRQGEIGIRRAFGALPADILQQVAVEGVAVSLVGGLVGLALGLPTAWLLARSQALGLGFTVAVVVGPLLLVILAALAGVLPARAAARLDPAVALRSR